MMPGFVRQVVRGLGGRNGSRFTVEQGLVQLDEHLRKFRPAIETMVTPGWEIIQREYRTWLQSQKDYVLNLALDPEKNKEEMKIRRQLLFACEQWLALTDKIVSDYKEAAQKKQGYERQNTAQTVGRG
ncbi:MAG: hypothetical protein ACYTBX_19755 [Planctomycetota bacterium]|jgi:hypothetical protein